MLQAVGQLLPIAAAGAVSSVPITAMIMILLSERRSASAVPFLVGWILGLAAVVSLCALGARAVPVSRFGRQDTALGIAEIIVGAGLVAGAFIARRRAAPTAPGSLPKWLRGIGALGPLSAFGVALVLNVRPKAILLGLAGGLVLRGAGLPLGQAAVVIAVYTAIAASSVAVPIVMTLAAPARMEPRLVRAREWLGRNGPVVSAAVLAIVGIVAIGNGLTRL